MPLLLKSHVSGLLDGPRMINDSSHSHNMVSETVRLMVCTDNLVPGISIASGWYAARNNIPLTASAKSARNRQYHPERAANLIIFNSESRSWLGSHDPKNGPIAVPDMVVPLSGSIATPCQPKRAL